MARKILVAGQHYADDLAEAVDIIFEMATYVKDWTWQELAKKAGLAYNTVWRLGSRETVWVRYSTLRALAIAVGLRLAFVDARQRVVAPGMAKAPVHARRSKKPVLTRVVG